MPPIENDAVGSKEPAAAAFGLKQFYKAIEKFDRNGNSCGDASFRHSGQISGSGVEEYTNTQRDWLLLNAQFSAGIRTDMVNGEIAREVFRIDSLSRSLPGARGEELRILGLAMLSGDAAFVAKAVRFVSNPEDISLYASQLNRLFDNEFVEHPHDSRHRYSYDTRFSLLEDKSALVVQAGDYSLEVPLDDRKELQANHAIHSWTGQLECIKQNPEYAALIISLSMRTPYRHKKRPFLWIGEYGHLNGVPSRISTSSDLVVEAKYLCKGR